MIPASLRRSPMPRALRVVTADQYPCVATLPLLLPPATNNAPRRPLPLSRAQGKALAGGATFACLLMLKHLFLSLAPLYFVYLLRHYCIERGTALHLIPQDGGGSDVPVGSVVLSGDGDSEGKTSARGMPGERQPGPPSASRSKEEAGVAAQLRGEHAARLSWKRLASQGSVVLCVFLSALGPLCVSDGWAREACLRMLNQLAVRLFPFGRFVFPFGRFSVIVRDVNCFRPRGYMFLFGSLVFPFEGLCYRSGDQCPRPEAYVSRFGVLSQRPCGIF